LFPADCETPSVELVMFPLMYHAIVEAGLEESVVQVSVNLLAPVAIILAFPVMLVKRGATKEKDVLYTCAY